MKKFFLLITCLLFCPFQSILAETTTDELNRLRTLSQRVELQLPQKSQERLSTEQAWVEDSISVGQAAPRRETETLPRPLVQQDLELEAMVLENLEYQPLDHSENSRRTRSRSR